MDAAGSRPATETVPQGEALLAAIMDLVRALRQAAVPISTVEAKDALASLRHVSLEDPDRFEVALGTTLVKRESDLDVFRRLFEARFRRAPPGQGAFPSPAPADNAAPANATTLPDEPASPELLAGLVEALRKGDLEALRALAALAVARFAGLASGQAEGARLGSERHYLYRVLRQLELSNLWQRAGRVEAGQEGSPMAERLAREEIGRRIEELRRLIAEEIRRRLADLRELRQAPERPRPALEDVPFLGASPAELREMRKAIRPLARALAARIAQRRRSRQRGRLDLRRTLRRSLSAGGVPLFPAFRRRRVSKPELVLLCDVSGSVAEFAGFTMSLLAAMGQEFSRVRSFAFVDGVDEVSAAFASDQPPQAVRHLLARARLVFSDGHSDYGRVFARFQETYGIGLTPGTTLIITGDARNNYREAGLADLRSIRNRVRRLYWLNPEPRSSWNRNDSIMAAYGAVCDGVFEVATLRQLARFVLEIADGVRRIPPRGELLVPDRVQT